MTNHTHTAQTTQPQVGNNGTIAFTKVNLPYGWLGNMAAEPVVYQGKRYRTSEALFQCMRFEGHPAVQQAIRDCASPMAAKMAAKKHRHLIQGTVEFLGAEDVERMRLCLRLKVEQHSGIRRMFLATGDRLLVEDVSKRRGASALFWGAYWDAAQSVWVGQNTLGRCWMELRSNLQSAPLQAA
jgi:predicted NAD-dependent protein-ADP-ribosyltransferase YbiA (DUF1768 family)